MERRGSSVVVGYDKRFLSENFASTVAGVLYGNGFKVFLTDTATPTPVISFSVVNLKTAGAVNITASHNPPTDNGFKVRNEFGGAIDPEGLLEIENYIPDDVSLGKENYQLSEGTNSGNIIIFDPAPAYIEHLTHLIDVNPIKKLGYQVLWIVCGVMVQVGSPAFFEGGKTQILEIHNQRNPIYPEMKRPEPIPPNINVGLQTTVDTHSDVLLITDGDADRLGIGDENGEFLNQLQVYGIT